MVDDIYFVGQFHTGAETAAELCDYDIVEIIFVFLEEKVGGESYGKLVSVKAVECSVSKPRVESFLTDIGSDEPCEIIPLLLKLFSHDRLVWLSAEAHFGVKRLQISLKICKKKNAKIFGSVDFN